MAVLTVDFVQSDSAAGLKADLAAAILAGKQPHGEMFVDPENGLLTWAVITGTVDGTFEDALARIDMLETNLTATETLATNLNAWAVALATKLNADAGVTDVNYDTNPQA